MHVTPIPCFRDNYAYLVWNGDGREAIVVDASEAQPVLKALKEHSLVLRAVLCTHHHWDHVGGNLELAERFADLKIFGHTFELGRIPALSQPLSDDETFEVAGIEWQALHVPGHTLGAIAYRTSQTVFTGDTLFVAGCGRLFEGSPEVMFNSLNHKLATLPEETQVYCGHEYTLTNLRFARHVEPSNLDVERAVLSSAELRVTVPSTIGMERRINPFLRCSEPTIVERVMGTGAVECRPEQVFARLRHLKDRF